MLPLISSFYNIFHYLYEDYDRVESHGSTIKLHGNSEEYVIKTHESHTEDNCK